MVDKCNVLRLFNAKNMVKTSAPMVRYSKLPFRTLVRKYGCDLCFTPMIMADSYIKSSVARSVEFTTNSDDSPVIVQFAAKNDNEFVNAAELVAPLCNGVDLNCGCPQRWALEDCCGAYLLQNPQIIKDCVSQLRNRIPDPFTISIKIRIFNQIRETIELCRQIEHAGVSFITVHGRTVYQRKEPINKDAILNICQSVHVPIIANGDIKNIQEAEDLFEYTKCKGVMSARGLLENPALYKGYAVTPISVIQDWLSINHDNFMRFHNHLMFMCHKLLTKSQRNVFSTLTNALDVAEYLEDALNVSFPNKSQYNALCMAHPVPYDKPFHNVEPKRDAVEDINLNFLFE